MKFILSPAKSMNFDKQDLITKHTSISFPDKTEKIMKKLKKLSAKKIGDLMNVSAAISDLNYGRFQEFSNEFTDKNAKQAILAFTGDAYRGMDASSFSSEEFDYAQQHLRILSGLYGFLKPLDLIQPYRLEMGTKIEISSKEKNLYSVWKEINTAKLSEELNGDYLVNLASNEYFKSIDVKKLNGKLLTIGFKDFKNGEYKTIMTYAKFARGLMSRYIIKNQLTDVEGIKGFNYENYTFNSSLSSENEWLFTRG
ncbi:MAG: peroxide stress protein YaaA [Flavobacteriales bacterium]